MKFRMVEDDCPECGGGIIEAEFGETSEAFRSDESVSGFICEEDCGYSGIIVDAWDVDVDEDGPFITVDEENK